MTVNYESKSRVAKGIEATCSSKPSFTFL